MTSPSQGFGSGGRLQARQLQHQIAQPALDVGNLGMGSGEAL